MEEHNDDVINIKLTMGGEIFPLLIKRKDEEIARKAAHDVDELLNRYKKRYPDKGDRSCLLMVAYQLSLRKLEAEQRNDTVPYTEKLKELTKELEHYIAQDNSNP